MEKLYTNVIIDIRRIMVATNPPVVTRIFYRPVAVDKGDDGKHVARLGETVLIGHLQFDRQDLMNMAQSLSLGPYTIISIMTNEIPRNEVRRNKDWIAHIKSFEEHQAPVTMKAERNKLINCEPIVINVLQPTQQEVESESHYFPSESTRAGIASASAYVPNALTDVASIIADGPEFAITEEEVEDELEVSPLFNEDEDER